MRASVIMARAAAGELGRLWLDACGDLVGTSLPFRAGRVARPEALNRLITEGALQPFPRPPQVTAVHAQDVPSVSSNCHNLVLSLVQAEPASLPGSIFVKLPMAPLATRWFLSLINAWRLESWFFRHLAAQLPIRTPVTYATLSRGTRFLLVQENLRDDPSVHLFNSLDMLAGPSLETVHRCLDTFARLHSHFHGLPAQRREALLPRALHLFLSPRSGAVSRLLNQLALQPCLRKRPGEIPDTVVAAYRDSLAHWDALLAFWFSEPLTLLHGDSHLGNCFAAGETMGMLDWQAVHWGKGIRDVQYFLIDSLPAATLASHEGALVDYYIARRAHYGTAIDPVRTWAEYRSFTFHTLMTIVVSIGFGALNREQDGLMAEVLRRAVAAVQRVDYPGWLREFLAQGE